MDATNNGVQLTPKEILEKDFKTNVRGYSKDEVDKFLDSVIKDYEWFQKELESLQQENAKLRKELDKNSGTPKRHQPAAGNMNYDILKRLSNLEKHVFGSKLNDYE